MQHEQHTATHCNTLVTTPKSYFIDICNMKYDLGSPSLLETTGGTEDLHFIVLHFISIFHFYISFLHFISTFHFYISFLYFISIFHFYISFLHFISTFHFYISFLHFISTFHRNMQHDSQTYENMKCISVLKGSSLRLRYQVTVLCLRAHSNWRSLFCEHSLCRFVALAPNHMRVNLNGPLSTERCCSVLQCAAGCSSLLLILRAL